MWNKAKEKRHFLYGSTNKDGEILWAHVENRKKYQKVLEKFRRKIYDWIINHQ